MGCVEEKSQAGLDKDREDKQCPVKEVFLFRGAWGKQTTPFLIQQVCCLHTAFPTEQPDLENDHLSSKRTDLIRNRVH